MAGLRAKHKAHRTTRIIETAAALFRTVGYEAAKVEDIAVAADVSVGTIYNYYANKGDLLVSIVAMEVNEVLTNGEAIIVKPPTSALRAVNALMSTYMEHTLVWLDKPMWRQAMATAILQPDSPFGNSYAKLDEELSSQVGRLISRLQKAGRLSLAVDARALGNVLFNNMDRMFIGFIKSNEGTVDELLMEIATQNKLLLKPYSV